MKAFVLEKLGSPPTYIDIPIPQPSPDEVLIKVSYCGVNQVDLKVLAGTYAKTTHYPLTMGAEIVGTLPNGQRVAVNSYLYCGTCTSCKKKEYLTCQKGRVILGVHRNGGFAEYLVAPKKNIIKIPDDISFEDACAILVSAGTSYRMIFTKAKVQKNETVIISAAASGVGVYSCQLCLLLGATVIALAGSNEKLERLSSLGVKHLINYSEKNWQEKLTDQTKNGVDVFIDTVGGKIFESIYSLVSPNGRIVLCGATENPVVSLNLIDLYNKQKTLMGSSGRTDADIKNLFKLLKEKKVKSIIDSIYTFQEIPKALDKLRSRNIFGKILIKIS